MPSDPAQPTREWFFTGSSRPEDYIIDLSLDPGSQPTDVQVYAECVARAAHHRAFPEETTAKIPRGVYEPQLDVVAQGLQQLKDAAEAKTEGLWLDATDITPEDVANYPHNPWLATLIRTERLQQVGSKIEDDLYAPGSSDNVVYGNIRIAFPTHLLTPVERSDWMRATTAVYGKDHPAIDLTRDYDSSIPEAKLVRKLRYLVSNNGLSHTMEPVLPCTAREQARFDRDPGIYDADRWTFTMRGYPQTVWPEGYQEYLTERARREDAEREEESKANDSQQPAE